MMEMSFDEFDFQSMKMRVKVLSASKCGLKDAQYSSEADLDSTISLNPEINQKLQAVLTAYRAWLDFHIALWDGKRWGRLEEKEIVRLGKLIDERERASSDLIDLLKK